MLPRLSRLSKSVRMDIMQEKLEEPIVMKASRTQIVMKDLSPDKQAEEEDSSSPDVSSSTITTSTTGHDEHASKEMEEMDVSKEQDSLTRVSPDKQAEDEDSSSPDVSSSTITTKKKKLFTDSPAIKKLMEDGVGGNSSPSLFSKMRALFSEINTKMWKSELHLLFLGFRSNSRGRILPIELFKGVKAASEVLDGGSPLFEKSTEDFMLLFTAEHVGCIYKLMSYFGYRRPMSQSLSQADLINILTHSDVDSYVELAAYHLRKIFGDKDHIVANKDFNFNILRLVYNTYYMG